MQTEDTDRDREPHHRKGFLSLWLATSCLLVLVLSLDGASPGASSPLPVPTAAELAPEISAVAEHGGLPDHVVVRFHRPVLAPWIDEGAVPAGTWVGLNPPLPGHLDVRDAYSFVFVPRHGFAPATDYRFELRAVESEFGIVMAPTAPDRSWQHEFRTPAFVLERVDVEKVDLEANTLDLDLYFTAPVVPASLQQHFTWTLDRRPPRHLRYHNPALGMNTASAGKRIRARVSGWALRGESRLELTLDDRLPMAGRNDALAATVTHVVQLSEPESLHIKSVHVQEAATGHFIEVVCHDDSVDGGSRYHWDRATHRSYQLSRRCVPEESSGRERIRFEPTRSFRITPSEAGFRIFGDFERGDVTVIFEEGLRSEEGGVLDVALEQHLTVPARSAHVSFLAKGRYLPRDVWKSLPIRHVNLEEVRLEVHHVPPKNLVYWMATDSTEATDEREADRIVDEVVALRGEPDTTTTSWIDVAALVPPETRGLLQITISGKDSRGMRSRDTARLLLTDLHLVAKATRPDPEHHQGNAPVGDVLAWALDSSSLGPMAGTELSLVRKSGRVMARCTTDESGGCRLRPREDATDDARPFAILARRGADLTYLKFSELETEIAEERVHGSAYGAAVPYRAALYADRGVYRPGEQAHVVAVLRDAQHRAPPAGMPVTLEVLDPREKHFRRVTLPTNDAGMVLLDLGFADFATTGRYRVRAVVGERRVGETRFHVEEFVPERMEVEARPLHEAVAPGERAEVAIEARYLFGGMPAGDPVEIACRIEPSIFRPKAHPDFRYGPWVDPGSTPRSLRLGEVRGELDDRGRATLACPTAAQSGALTSPGTVHIDAAVFEAGSGRTTVGRARVPFHPERFYIGLESGARSVGAGRAFSVRGVVVDWQGELVTEARTIDVELARLEREYGWSYDESTGRGRYTEVTRTVSTGTVAVEVTDGRFEVLLTPQEEAEAYLVRARAGAARTDLRFTGSADRYRWMPFEGGADRTPRPTRPGWIDLDAPARLRVGESATLRFDAPYAGRVLLTVETDRVLASEWRTVEAGPVEWQLPALARFEPNVYLSAFLVKRPYMDDGQTSRDEAGFFLPDRAFGVRSVRMEPEQLKRALRLEVPTEVRSRGLLEVTLDIGPGQRSGAGPSFATVAVVDEGVLSLTGFKSPDPLETILARRALGVATFETVGWSLLLPPTGAVGSHGGDAGDASLGRTMPVQPVALFSGLVEIPEDGRLRLPFELPAYRGRLRVMAVVADRARIGRATASVTVRDPLVVQSTLPRFLVASDEVVVPVSVTNLSGRARPVQLSITLEAEHGADLDVALLGATEQQFQLADGERRTARFRIAAHASAGLVRVRVEARSGDLESSEERSVPLVPAGPRTRTVKLIELDEGRTDLTPALVGWLPMSERTSFRVTRNRYGEVFDHLRYLVRYPYGCIEQTTSSTRPLLHVRELVGSLALWPDGGAQVDDMVARGIERIFSMQTPSGGFAYWPGGMTPSHWGTAYATQLLLEARQAGHVVPEQRLEEVLDWIEDELENKIERGMDVHGRWGRKSEPYMQYVLARAGRGRPARVRDLVARIPKTEHGRPAEQRLLLMAALYLSGDRTHEQELLAAGLEPLSEHRENGWTFYSDRRRRGLTLAVLSDLFSPEQLGHELPDLVARALSNHSAAHYTTQEIAWGITGLGKYIMMQGAPFEAPRLVANGSVVQPQPVDDPAQRSERNWSLFRASEYEQLEVVVEQKGEGKLYLIASSEGVRDDAPSDAGGEGLAIERRYFRLDGTLVELATDILRLGEPLLVELSLSNLERKRLPNLALVDRLPAGFEIENARLGRGGALDWIDTERLWALDHMNVRDDRIEVFGALGPLEMRKLVYVVRATAAGRFTVPSPTAEAMYDPRVWARGEALPVRVRGPEA